MGQNMQCGVAVGEEASVLWWVVENGRNMRQGILSLMLWRESPGEEEQL